MNPRHPPRLANWLLNRFGVFRENPPLAGDLLEEFRSGRSAAWYWRQTLIVIFSGLDRNAGQRLIGSLIGWAAEVGVAFPLWRFHILPQPPQIVQTIAWTTIAFFFLWLFVFARKGRSKAPPALPPPPAKSVAAYAWGTFFEIMPVYCLCSFLGADEVPGFWLLQVLWLYLVLRSWKFRRRYFQG
jgi:hypothetical protein